MLRKSTQRGRADWAFTGLLVALGIALVGNLLMTGLETYMASGYGWYAARCPEDYRIRQRFEELLFPRQGGIGVVGPDGQPASGKDWALPNPVPISSEIAACLPDRLVGDKLRLPEGVNPLIAQEAILAATMRVHRQALASVPPPSPRCRGLLWRHVGHWLLVGWTPVLVFVALFLLARHRARRTSRAD
jgi:hypothetical protein